MSSIQSLFLDIARHIQDALERGDKAELNRIHELALAEASSRKATEDARRGDRHRSAFKSGSRDEEGLRDQFLSFETREQLEAHLNEHYRTKAEIERVARTLHLSIMKTDTQEALVNNVIDATLGYRLRSLAIRGDEPKS